MAVKSMIATATAAAAPPRSVGWGYAEIAAAILAQYDPCGATTQPLRVLEAGGGSDSWLPHPPGTQITTIDISLEQLAQNTYAHEKLHGDLQTFNYGNRRFDLVVCWDVLEHLKQPDAAVARLAGVLAPGGRLIIKGPLKYSVKGLATRLTPHRLHVAFYRHVLKSPTAGLAGHPPFKAFLASGSEPVSLRPLLARHGLSIDALATFESTHITAIARRSSLLLAAYRVAERALSLVSFGRYRHGATDFYVIAHRPA